jgi:hypothetical protein
VENLGKLWRKRILLKYFFQTPCVAVETGIQLSYALLRES